MSRVFVACGVIAGSAACLFAQATLQITKPTDGTVVNPGQMVVVNVSTTGGPFTGVGLIAPGNLTSTQALTAPPYQFSFTVPSPIIPGPYWVSAYGTTAPGDTIFSSPVFLDFERADSPQSISVNDTQLELRIGRQVLILVLGTYSDGSRYRYRKR